MSGHSKWSKIKRQKKAADVKKGQLFTKLGQAITNAVREGHGADPDMNFMLRMAMDQAKEANMPKDTIQRAIDKGLGIGDGVELEQITFEVVGKNGVGILVDCHTDNKNRTMLDIKTAVGDFGFEIGTGISWQFRPQGYIKLESKRQQEKEIKGKKEVSYKAIPKDETILKIMEEEGVVDINDSKDDTIEVFTKKSKFNKVLEVLRGQKYKINEAKIVKTVQNKVKLKDNATELLREAVDSLDEVDEVDAVWVNVDTECID